jgi:ABC-2 type transport system ATP-binding protein
MSALPPASPVTPALKIAGVSHSYGPLRALDDVSFEVAPGSFRALLGLNGAGKSTLFSLITRLFDRQTGDIDVFGFDVRRDASQALRRIGVVFQSRTLDPDLTVLQNMQYHASLHGLPGRQAQERAAAELERAGLGAKLRSRVRDLSGGQQRRVEIVRAFLHRPRLMLLDEPTVGLDVEARRGILDLVRQLADERGVGVLWATHLIDEVRDSDPVVVLHKGRVLADARAEAIMRRTGQPSLLAAFETLIGGAIMPQEIAR